MEVEMNKRFKIGLVLFVMITMSAMLFAGGAQESDKTAAAGDVVTLEWWTWSSEEYDEAVQREMVKAFEAAHPNIKINMTLMPTSGFETKMTTALGAGEGAPDVAFYSIANWFPMAMDLNPFIERDNFDTGMYYDGFWKTRTQWNGTTIGLPLGVGAQFVMYNKDIFDAAGVAYPTSDWTTEDYLAMSPKLVDRSKKVWASERPKRPYRAIWYNYGEKARLYSPDSQSIEGYLNSDESVAAYQWMWDLVQSDVTPSQADMATLGTENTGPVDLFMAGRLAMATLNQGHMLNAVKEGMNFGIVSEPGVAGNERWVNAWSLTCGIWKETKHPEEAWTFLKWWVGPEGQKFLMDNGNLFPSIPDVLKQYKDINEDYAQGFFKVLENKQVSLWRNTHPSGTPVERSIGDLWDKINLGLIGRNEIKAELDMMVAPAQEVLDEARGRLGS